MHRDRPRRRCLLWLRGDEREAEEFLRGATDRRISRRAPRERARGVAGSLAHANVGRMEIQ